MQFLEASRPESYAMFLRNLIIYAVAGSVLWVIAQRLGAGIGVALAASLLVPPLASSMTRGRANTSTCITTGLAPRPPGTSVRCWSFT